MAAILKLILLGCWTVSCFSIVYPTSNCTEQPPIEEVSSLVALYDSTKGPTWIYQWPIRANESVTGYNPCLLPWYGVYCRDGGPGSSCRVVALELDGNLLQGPLLPSLANLTQLIVLRFFSNLLTGTVPPIFELMPSLTLLELSANDFHGPLPTVGPGMLLYGATYNKFSGPIPAALLQHSQLTDLSVSGNLLTGPIPDFSAMQSLTGLQINDNLFEGSIPRSLQNLSALSNLVLGSNNLDSAPFPSWMCEMSGLQQLSMASIAMTGAVPDCLAQLRNLSTLLLNSNQLTGTIPESIGRIASLVTLDLDSNDLTGSIPAVLTKLPALQVLNLFQNRLTGTIPDSIGDLRETCTGLELFSNLLTGTVPAAIGELVKVEDFVAYSNLFSGSLPTAICNLTAIFTFNLNENLLTGSLPPCIGRMYNVDVLQLANNFLTGPVPTSVGDFDEMYQFELQDNRLTGPLPPRIAANSFAQLVILMHNFLTGSVPAAYGQAEILELLLLENNLLSISLPELLQPGAFGNLESLGLSYNFVHGDVSVLPLSLHYLDMAGVHLNGTVPVALLQSATLQYLELQANALTGTLPPEVFTTSIARVFLNDNALRGPFPSLSTADNCTAQYLSLSNNALTGRLPTFLSRCKALTSFVASSLQLTGPIEGLFGDLPLLQELVLTDNALTGSVEDVFAASTASGLVFNAAYNQFTGSLPTRSLQNGQWAALILTQNCLTGTLPGDALCANEGLSEVLLSGLHSAPQCRSDVLDLPTSWHVYSSYVEAGAVGGTLPGCVLSLPQLSFVALSGNALRGSIPSGVNLSTALQGLDLSHNELTGSIPAAVLRAELQLLDLSFNRLAGSLSATATDYYARDTESKVSLQVNMLSGELPASWVDAANINVLDGNMFSCAAGSVTQTANSPVNDPETATYACGSSSTNLSLLVVAVLFAALTVAGLCAYRFVQQRWETEWREVRRIVWQQWTYAAYGAALAALLLASMTLYAVLAVTTSAYADLYIWVVALSLQRGAAATGLLLVWLLLCTLLVLTARDRLVGARPASTSVTEPETSGAAPDAAPGPTAVSLQTALSVVALVGLHAAPVFAVNMLYVYATTLRLSLSRLTAVILAMALFKLLWNGGLNVLVLKHAHLMTEQLRPATVASLLASVAMFNVIVSPMLTESLVSPNCFQYAFSRIPSDTYAVAGGTCYWIFYYISTPSATGAPMVAFPCMSFAELQATYNSGSAQTGGNYNMVIISTFSNGEASTVNFQAGFAYNFQCCFSLLEAFVHVFVYRYAISVFALPALWLLLKRWQLWTYERFGGSHKAFWVVSRLLPPLYRLVDVDVGAGGADPDALALTNMELLRQYFPDDARQVHVSAETLYLRLVMDVAVGLSFGLLFPLLGLLALVGGAVDLWTTKWMLDVWQRHRQRIAEVGGESGVAVSDDYVQRLERTTRQLEVAYSEIVPRAAGELGSVLGYSALLWGFALYDILGRDAGAVGGVWVFVVVALMPHWAGGLLWAGRRVAGSWLAGRPASGDSQSANAPRTDRRDDEASAEKYPRETELRVSSYSSSSIARKSSREVSSEEGAEVCSALHMS